jgi:hypothetical protein
MYRYVVYGTYGWLLLGGTMHLAIDVVSQYVRGKTHTRTRDDVVFWDAHCIWTQSNLLRFVGTLGR